MAGGKIAAKVGRAACPHAAEGGVLAAKNAKSAKAMKPSGVAWLGDIPEGWEMRRLKTCFSIVSGSGFKEHLQGRTDGDYPVFKARDIGKADVTLNYSKNWITSDEVETEGFKIIPANSILMPKIGEAMRKNSRAISGVACCVDNNCQGLLPRMVDVKLSYYLLCSIDVRAFDNGGAIPCINNQAFLDFSCPLPPLPEQRAIADYLDEKCGAIDAAIAEAKKGIEEYKAWKKSLIFEAVTGKRRVGVFNAEKQSCREAEKMKPSGIPWIGEIPEGWRVVKGKYLLSANSGIALRNELLINIGNYPVFGGGEVIGYTDNWNCDAKTILIGRVGARCGCVTLLNDKSWATDNALIVSTNEEPRYLSYLLIGADLNQYNSSNAQPLITAGRIRNLMFPHVDDIREQQAIADYLDEKCAAIDAMVAEKEALIADLEAYKKSLIYETVTGKREVA